MDPLMIIWTLLIGIIIGIIFGLTILYKSAVNPLNKRIDELLDEKETILSSNNNIKNFELFLKKYPYDIKNFRYITNPIDGIQFNTDEIIFIKIKTNNPIQTENQNKIINLIKKEKINWFELKI